jgi:signal peptidase I
MKPKEMRCLIRLSMFSLVFFLTVAGVRIFFCSSYRITADTMENTLREGDRVLVNKWRDASNPGRNRTVLFRVSLYSLSPTLLPGRCAGMPGDTLWLSAGEYRLNGRRYPLNSTVEQPFRIHRDIRRSLLDALTQLDIPYRSVAEDAQNLTFLLTCEEERRLSKRLPQLIVPESLTVDTLRLPFVIPFSGYACRLDSSSLKLFQNIIIRESGQQAVIHDGKLQINGLETDTFRFQYNYYWILIPSVNEPADAWQPAIVCDGDIIGNVFFCWFSRHRQYIFKGIH